MSVSVTPSDSATKVMYFEGGAPSLSATCATTPTPELVLLSNVPPGMATVETARCDDTTAHVGSAHVVTRAGVQTYVMVGAFDY